MINNEMAIRVEFHVISYLNQNNTIKAGDSIGILSTWSPAFSTDISIQNNVNSRAKTWKETHCHAYLISQITILNSCSYIPDIQLHDRQFWRAQ